MAAAPIFDDIRRLGGGDDAVDIVVKFPVLRNSFFDVVRVELVPAGCLDEVAVFGCDDGVGVVGRRTAGVVVVVMDTSRDVTERDAELVARRLLNSLVAAAVVWRPRLVDLVLARASIPAGPLGRLDSRPAVACDAVAMFGVDR